MNKIIILRLSVILTMLSCCRVSDPVTLEVYPDKLSFSGSGESQAVTVKCSTKDWEWRHTFSDWLSIKKVDNSSVVITAQSNPESSPRKSKITFVCEDVIKTINVEQVPKPIEYFFKAPEQIDLDDVDSPRSIQVETNAPTWEIVEKPQWLKVSKTNKVLTITPSNNTEPDKREGAIIIEAGGKRAQINVTQSEMAFVKINQELSIFSYRGGEQTITLTSNRKDIKLDQSIPPYHFTIKEIGDHQLKITAPRNKSAKMIKESFSIIYKNRTLINIKVNQEKSNIEADQRAYLVEFFKATNGEKWTNNTNWLSDKPLAEWYGIVMGDEGNGIFKLSLNDNNLSGRIPDGFDILVSAYYIKLKGNALEGQLPIGLTKLKETMSIDLSNNNFTGSIPALNSGEFHKLKILDLRGNQLSGTVPDSFIKSPKKFKFCPQQEGYKFDNYQCN